MSRDYRIGKGSSFFYGGHVGDVPRGMIPIDGESIIPIYQYDRLKALDRKSGALDDLSRTVTIEVRNPPTNPIFIGGRILYKKTPSTPEYIEMIENITRVEALPLSHQEVTVVSIQKTILSEIDRMMNAHATRLIRGELT